MSQFLSGQRPVVLCLASSARGGDFIRELHEHGCEVVLLTTHELAADPGWPRDAISFVHAMPELSVPQHVLNGVSWLARAHALGHIVALDDRDLGVVALLREHLCLDGMGVTETRPFRDRLTLRMAARGARLPVAQFSALFNDEEVRRWSAAVPPPWLLKPRDTSLPAGERRVESGDALWPLLERLGDERSRYLLERDVPGERFRAVAIVAGGRIACTGIDARSEQTLDRSAIGDLAERLIATLAPAAGPVYVECLRAGDGRYRLIEVAARPGDEDFIRLVRVTAGLDLWREWARAEIATMQATALPVRSGMEV